MSQFDAVINALPAPTWNRLHMNEVKVSLEEKTLPGTIQIENPDGVCLEESSEAKMRYAAVPTGMGADIDKALADAESILVFTAENKVAEPVRVNFTFDEAHVGRFVGIEAKENAGITVIMDFASEKKADAQDAIVQTKILADKNALVRLVQIHRAGEEETVYNDTGSVCAEDARVEIIHIVLGRGNSLIGMRTELQGDRSSLKTDIGYRVQGSDRLDVNYIANHYGKHTTCDIDALGVLRDEAFKVFRGTIDFKRGSKASVGNEKEDVLLMDEDVINQTIPLILCAEEDVEGNHGATIGQLDEEAMFYLQSRGMSEESILKLMEKGRLTSVIHRIDDAVTRERLLGYVE